MRLLRWCATMIAVGSFAACSDDGRPLVPNDSGNNTGDTGSNTGMDSGMMMNPNDTGVINPVEDTGVPPVDTGIPVEVDGGGIYDDAGGASDVRTGCGSDGGTARPTGCLGAEVANNGLDDNCNGVADETSSCIPGSVQRCFLGPPGRRGVGACVDGMQTCQGAGEFGTWGPCMGGISPRGETCDSLDNNCDGLIDENLCCNSGGTCPAPGDPRIPTGGPFHAYTLRGSDFLAGGTRYRWHVVGGPCDQLLFATSRSVSYTLNNPTGTTGNTLDAEGANLVFKPTLSGDYTVTLTITRPDGTTFECTFIIPIRAAGFRAELCWDRTGATDIDFWVHRPGNTNTWYATAWPADNCMYGNCRNSQALNWGYARTPGTDCREPLTGGGCNNPRLDIDNISTAGVPENINVDNPRANDTFRVGVNYYGGTGAVRPMVNIYCGGQLRATYGGADVGGMRYGSEPVMGFNTSGSNTSGSLWRVADVTMMDASNCTLAALHPRGTASGYCVATNTDRTYDGTCSR